MHFILIQIMRKDSNDTLVTATNSVQKSIVSACFIMKTMLTPMKLYFYFLEFFEHRYKFYVHAHIGIPIHRIYTLDSSSCY